MTSLSDLLAILSLKHLAAIVLVAIAFAGLMEFALKDEGKVPRFAINSLALTVNLFALCFLAYAGWNTIVNQRYGSGDLFLSGLLVFGGFVATAIIAKNSTEPEAFHPALLILGAIATLMVSGLFAVLLPLVGKFSAWMR